MKRLISILIVCLLLLPLAAPVLAANPVSEAKHGVVGVVAGIIYDNNGKAIDILDGAGSGTGFGVGRLGEDAQVFLTNYHVVDAAVENDLDPYICIDGTDFSDEKTLIRCEVLAWDAEKDLAVLRTGSPVRGVANLPVLRAEEMEVGASVYALGYPDIADAIADESTYRIEDMTITDGIISRYLTSDGVKCMAHTAAINHGNSGGPLINEKGQVIGMNTWGHTEDADTRFYAVYIDYSLDVLDELGLPYEDGTRKEQAEKDWLRENLVLMICCAAAALLVPVILVMVLKKKKQAAPVPVPGPDPDPDPVPGPVPPVLLKLTAGDFIKTWTLTGSKKLGRSHECELQLPPDTKCVSRIHLSISLVDGHVYVTDLGSTYGTVINGTRLEPHRPVSCPRGTAVYIGSNHVCLRIE